jgi:hypothetical protein
MTPQFLVSSTLLLCRGLVSSVVNEVRYRTLHALGQDLLDLLGDNRILAVVQRMCLGGGLAGGTAGRVDLQYRLAIERSKCLGNANLYLIWKSLLKTFRCSVLHTLGHC